MSWSVIGKIGLAEAFPSSKASFIGHAMAWHHVSYVGGPKVTELVAQSKCNFAIYRSETAKNILSDLLERGDQVLSELQGHSTISFTWFSYYPEEKLGTCNFVIGLDDREWEHLSPQLYMAMIHKLQFRMNAEGNLAWSTTPNDLKRATPDEFEGGKAVALTEVSIRLINEEMLK